MDNDYVTMQFHNEYAQRMKDEDDRQNYRIKALEKAVAENSKLAVSVERLALSVQSMVEEQKAQGERLETLENRDGEKWRNAARYVLTTILGIVVGYVFKQIGM